MSNSLQDYRDFYAKFIVASAGSSNARVISAFAKVPRERFLGPGPWLVFTGADYLSTISDDPALLYQDILIALRPEKRINNGQPSLHAKCLAAVDPAVGEDIVHIGAGTGYYTALLAHLVGPTSVIHAFEIEGDLAERARAALQDLPNVRVRNESASAAPLPSTDIIYVNAGVTHLEDQWLDALNPGGRLIVPLTPAEGFGGMLLATRLAPSVYSAQILGRVSFIPYSGNRSDAESSALLAAFEPRTFKAVRSLHRGTAPDESAWYAGRDWWLSTSEPGPARTH